MRPPPTAPPRQGRGPARQRRSWQRPSGRTPQPQALLGQRQDAPRMTTHTWESLLPTRHPHSICTWSSLHPRARSHAAQLPSLEVLCQGTLEPVLFTLRHSPCALLRGVRFWWQPLSLSRRCLWARRRRQRGRSSRSRSLKRKTWRPRMEVLYRHKHILWGLTACSEWLSSRELRAKSAGSALFQSSVSCALVAWCRYVGPLCEGQHRVGTVQHQAH